MECVGNVGIPRSLGRQWGNMPPWEPGVGESAPRNRCSAPAKSQEQSSADLGRAGLADSKGPLDSSAGQTGTSGFEQAVEDPHLPFAGG